ASQWRRVLFLAKSRLWVRDLFAVRAASDSKNDGRGESRSASGTGGVGWRSNKRQRSTALRSRPARRWKIYASWPPGIARAFWFEPSKRVVAARGRPIGARG